MPLIHLNSKEKNVKKNKVATLKTYILIKVIFELFLIISAIMVLTVFEKNIHFFAGSTALVAGISTLVLYFFIHIESVVLFSMNIKLFKEKGFQKKILIISFVPIINNFVWLYFLKKNERIDWEFLDKEEERLKTKEENNLNRSFKTFVLRDLSISLLLFLVLAASGMVTTIDNAILNFSAQEILRYIFLGVLAALLLNKINSIALFKSKTSNPKSDKTMLIIAWATFWIPFISTMIWIPLFLLKTKQANKEDSIDKK
ncbi:hypothetical protein SCHIN_v1c09640 [Spiroplasma chinense]|uniref:Uncharacterized protein n=1 Tax=Spiroplasma chinense TaxID=216932 RepID=A0A5B9Y777_9MOLU|nr:hypothetical protein [Spiroplasma chinense]QEH62157.1 hypothetical protein SCHIN_v1c09640 [Spiroplasma chinense]